MGRWRSQGCTRAQVTSLTSAARHPQLNARGHPLGAGGQRWHGRNSPLAHGPPPRLSQSIPETSAPANMIAAPSPASASAVTGCEQSTGRTLQPLLLLKPPRYPQPSHRQPSNNAAFSRAALLFTFFPRLLAQAQVARGEEPVPREQFLDVHALLCCNSYS